MKYTLIGSLRSPFVRICRILFIQNKIDFDFRILNFVDDAKDAEALSKETPINKVPILISGEQKIFDSRVIVNYLVEKHQLPKLSLEEENIVSAIYSCLDTGVILFLMKKDGFDINSPGFFMSRNRERIPNNINYILPWVQTRNPEKKDHWNYATMSLYSFLYWAQARQVYDYTSVPALVKFMDQFKEAPGVKETSF